MKTDPQVQDLVLMYVGNLEVYQGIELLLQSFALVLRKTNVAKLVIIGGEASHIKKYQIQSFDLGIVRKVQFLGPKPVQRLSEYLADADILLSPRIKGRNTPMKIYSYLHSGKPVVATALPTHTQVLDRRVAMLVKPTPEAFAEGILRLLEDPKSRAELGESGKKLVEEKFSYHAFRHKLIGLFNWLESEICQEGEIALRPVERRSKLLG
jgi:glycosyltransferase involved in cell wall biosynthesis